jgi:hypothetical protein
MAQRSKKSGATATRTKRSASAVAVPADFLTESEVVDMARRAGVSVTSGTLRNYRYRWSNGLSGEHGPQWFTGFGGRIRYQKSHVAAWLKRVQVWTPAPAPKKVRV